MPSATIRVTIGLVLATAVYIFVRFTAGEMTVYAKWLIAIVLYAFFIGLALRPKSIPADWIASLFHF